MVRVDDPEAYKKYAAQTPSIVKKYGGKFLARAGEVDTIEGEPFHDRLVIVEFPSKQAAREWYASPEYQAALKYRKAACKGQLLVIEGVSNTQAPDAKVVKSGTS